MQLRGKKTRSLIDTVHWSPAVLRIFGSKKQHSEKSNFTVDYKKQINICPNTTKFCFLYRPTYFGPSRVILKCTVGLYEYNEKGIRIMKRRCQLLRFVRVHILPYRGQALAQLVQTLLYKQEGRGFDSRWYDWKCSSYKCTKLNYEQFKPF